MFIQEFEDVQFISNSAQIKLPRSNLIIDPKANYPHSARFDCKYHDDGITVTLTTIESEYQDYDNGAYTFSMRVYDPANENVPDFDSTLYTYSGEDDELTPYDTTVATINPSVKTIKRSAFFNCKKMKKCIMHEGVQTIEKGAFAYCHSLEALFLPSSIKKIDKYAFSYCRNIRILSLPLNIDSSQIGRGIIDGCDTFFQITQIPQYRHTEGSPTNNDEVHQAIIHLYRNLPPLHTACLHINVSTQAIHDCVIAHGTQAASITDHDGMTPLHILAMNPHATVGCIGECLDADMSAAFAGDSRGNTPLDSLKEDNLEGHTWVVTSLCLHREAHLPSTSNNDGHRAPTNNINKRKRVNWNKMLSKIAFPLKPFSCLPLLRRLSNTHS